MSEAVEPEDLLRVRALLEAVVAITADLDLPVVLDRIIRAACTLANAKYGALGVIGDSGEPVGVRDLRQSPMSSASSSASCHAGTAFLAC